ncbi:hypothetical protein [Clostridium sp.]|uniref:hypothetical protein n=1 Tax=Clostridium sp. TaxID=1506 RepID=UPI003D6CA214
MGKFQERSQQIYDNLIERLDEEGYNISTSGNNEIVDLINDEQLENNEEFENLVKESKEKISFMRSQKSK